METLNLNLRYSYADYLTWFDDIRRELFDGFVFKMAAPVVSHQTISSNLHGYIWHFLLEKPCQVFHAPFDVRLPKNGEKENEKIFTVVQPDICVICDLSKLDEKGCLGAPDFIVEILSPSNSKNDLKYKFEIYEKAGVREYWVVRPDEKSVEVFLLNENGKYMQQKTYVEDEFVPVAIFNGELEINLEKVFRKK